LDDSLLLLLLLPPRSLDESPVILLLLLDELLLSALELLLGIIGPGSSSWGWCSARRCAIIPSWGG
jgi:hypothetical protein